MTIDIARMMLQLPREQNSTAIMVDNESKLVWDFDGQGVENWNAVFARPHGLPDVRRKYDPEDEAIFLEYKGVIIEVEIEFDRDDNMREIHALSQLVKGDSELRLGIDSLQNSEHGFLALLPAEWQQLDREFPAADIDARFKRMGSEVQEFIDSLGC